MAKAKVYVVTAPDRIRGIYASWPDCAAAVKGVSGARYQAVGSREQAEAMLRGEGTELEPGLYAFVDGNHLGGVGVVIVERAASGDPEIVAACRDLIGRRRLAVRFRHQRGHAAAWAGRDDFAHFNARADALASEAASER